MRLSSRLRRDTVWAVKIVAALREQDKEERAAWLGLAEVVRREGWDVDETRIPLELSYGTTMIKVGSPIPFDMSVVALYVAKNGTCLALVVGRGGIPERLDESHLFVNELPQPDEVRFASE